MHLRCPFLDWVFKFEGSDFFEVISVFPPHSHRAAASSLDPKSLLKNLFCRGAASAVIHVDVLHGDESDAVFLSIGCGTALR